MKNKALVLAKLAVPYLPALRNTTGSVTATILMQQLEFYFHSFPEGFYKFLEPCDHPSYRQGDSWIECLSFTKDEFRAAFDKIGVRYKSRTEFENSPEPFGGKFYASYFDRLRGLTIYLRNDRLVDKTLDTLLAAKNPRAKKLKQVLPEIGIPDFPKSEVPTSSISTFPTSPLYTEKSEKTVTETASKLAEDQPDSVFDKSKPVGHTVSGNVVSIGGKAMNAEEAIAAAKAKTAGKPITPTSKGLALLWQKEVSRVYGKFVPQLTMKQQGQLGHWLKRAPEPVETLGWVLAHWDAFTAKVKVVQDVKSTPTEPQIAFLLTYVQEAVNAYRESKQPKKLSLPEPSTAVQSSAKPESDEDKPASLDEVLKIVGS